MEAKCLDFLNILDEGIKIVNLDLVNKMTNDETLYENACVQKNITFDYYFKNLQKIWNKEINKFLIQNDDCNIEIQSLMIIFKLVELGEKYIDEKNIEQIKKLLSKILEYYQHSDTILKKLKYLKKDDIEKLLNKLKDDKNIDDVKKVVKVIIEEDSIYDFLIYYINLTSKNDDYELKENFLESTKLFIRIFDKKCTCMMGGILKLLLIKYKNKYIKNLKIIMGEEIKNNKNMNQEDIDSKIKDMMKKKTREYFDYIEKIIGSLKEKIDFNKTNKNLKISIDQDNALEKFIKDENITEKKDFIMKEIKYIKMRMVEYLDQIFNLSVEGELNRLIPKELGSLKNYFIKIISKYYDNLHPIIWCQIFSGVYNTLPKVLPLSKEELFGIISRQILLNSGPLILKILQIIRPILNEETQNKYGLKTLKYPLMTSEERDLVLSKILIDYQLYQIIGEFSASVGYVCLIRHVTTNKNFIIKIIKPISIAQTCWEYKTLHNLFGPEEACENNFIKNMLISNGKEMNVQNEKKNIIEGYEKYNLDYQKIFGTNIDVKLKTVEVINGIVKENSWFAFCMSVAPGIPLSKLVENNELICDTKYRARLHRCCDLLVYAFFYNIIYNGFYHGDLHAGNIYFSYIEKQITLIDFGAVGNINFLKNTNDSISLLKIILMSIFYNYVGILSEFTQLLNSKCDKTKKIDTETNEYNDLIITLLGHQINNISLVDENNKTTENTKKLLFSENRINEEMEGGEDKLFYNPLELPIKEQEVIIENRNTISIDEEKKGKNINFSYILKLIIGFYALNGVNVPVKFSELYEFQKAYLLLLGVLSNIGYNSNRTSIIISKIFSIWNFDNIKLLSNISGLFNAGKFYYQEKDKFEKIRDGIKNKDNETIIKIISNENK
jgi:hypothetical protein